MMTKEEYIKALLSVRDKGLLRNTKYLDMLRAHYKFENQTITAGKLADEVCYPNYNTANMHYGKLAHHIADELSFIPPRRITGDKEPIWLLTICSFNRPSEKTIDENWEFVMLPEFLAALEEMKWVR